MTRRRHVFFFWGVLGSQGNRVRSFEVLHIKKYISYIYFTSKIIESVPQSSSVLQVKIFKQWLSTKNRKEIKAEQYRSVVKQSMLLAAAKMEAFSVF